MKYLTKSYKGSGPALREGGHEAWKNWFIMLNLLPMRTLIPFRFN